MKRILITLVVALTALVIPATAQASTSQSFWQDPVYVDSHGWNCQKGHVDVYQSNGTTEFGVVFTATICAENGYKRSHGHSSSVYASSNITGLNICDDWWTGDPSYGSTANATSWMIEEGHTINGTPLNITPSGSMTWDINAPHWNFNASGTKYDWNTTTGTCTP